MSQPIIETNTKSFKSALNVKSFNNVVADRLTGTVKWFNNKAGFGFITICGDDGRDIFVHYSSIRVTNSQYKFLIQGEYVDFTLVTSNNDKHEFHAMDVTGVKGGPIMCETRSNVQSLKPEQEEYEVVQRRRGQGQGQGQGQGRGQGRGRGQGQGQGRGQGRGQGQGREQGQ